MIYNMRTVNIKVKRTQLIDLLIACNIIEGIEGLNKDKWKELHDLLRDQLEEFDMKNERKDEK